MSYLLSGYTPYVKPDAIHPHPLLQRKLAEAPGVSILDQVGESCGWEWGAGTHTPLGKTLPAFPGQKPKYMFFRHKTKPRKRKATNSATEPVREKPGLNAPAACLTSPRPLALNRETTLLSRTIPGDNVGCHN